MRARTLFTEQAGFVEDRRRARWLLMIACADGVPQCLEGSLSKVRVTVTGGILQGCGIPYFSDLQARR